MFRKIGGKIRRPDWCKIDNPMAARFCHLDCLDRLLDGTFYDHLQFPFYEEMSQGGKPIPLEERRPSARFELPRMVARWSSRKLFSGRHMPKIRHPNEKARQTIEALISRSRLGWHMADAVMRGSVGSVALTFRVDRENGGDPEVAIKQWPAKHCEPHFDDMGELALLRVRYLASGRQFIDMKAPAAVGGELKPEWQYWFIRDFSPDAEITYLPVLDSVWNPIQGFTKSGLELVAWPEESIVHKLGFVQGHWFVNLTGGCAPDGACTWEDAISTKIELDFLLSQAARGTRYNCAPQMVLIGEPVNTDGQIVRGPTYFIQLAAGMKDQEGNAMNAGDAKLLEMGGAGVEAALKMIEKLRALGLEQISAARKDPEKQKGPLSGRAMEYLDEDSHDLVMELRSAYGEYGMLRLLRKMVTASGVADAKPLSLQWPRIYQPTPDDMQKLVAAMALAMNPLAVPYQRAAPAIPGVAGADGKGGTPPTPAVEEDGPPEEFQLITPEQARLLIASNLDLTMMELEGAEVEQIAGEDVSAREEDASAPKAEEPQDV